ncbi:hypothetical protein [Polaromonas naphthalenivorans]|uniref:hypothetical protein n=1 Tax=Polaromonas naphthalenivorans TaxID=216465 RepID=UPI0003184FEE|nr:hypothetical protein [Polaromonas naphthalenivorans]
MADKRLVWRRAAQLEKNSKYLIGKRKIEEVLRPEFQARHAGLIQPNLIIIRFVHERTRKGVPSSNFILAFATIQAFALLPVLRNL